MPSRKPHDIGWVIWLFDDLTAYSVRKTSFQSLTFPEAQVALADVRGPTQDSQLVFANVDFTHGEPESESGSEANVCKEVSGFRC